MRGMRRAGLAALAGTCIAGLAVACSPASDPADGAADPAVVAAPDGPPPEDLLRDGVARYSQGKEELVVRHFFRDRRGGFYVDVGAWHWRDLSTTYYLERHLGWSGIAIDALPWLEEGWVENRPRARFFHYIVSDHSGAREAFHVSGAVSSTDPTWTDRFGVEKTRTIEVETITLDDLLAREGVEKVDFLSMDIEGGELRALAAFDIARWRPDLVCVEAARPEKRWAIRRWFEARGYELLARYVDHDRQNAYFAPADR